VVRMDKKRCGAGLGASAAIKTFSLWEKILRRRFRMGALSNGTASARKESPIGKTGQKGKRNWEKSRPLGGEKEDTQLTLVGVAGPWSKKYWGRGAYKSTESLGAMDKTSASRT